MDKKLVKIAIGIFFFVLLLQTLVYYRGFYLAPEVEMHDASYEVKEEEIIKNFPDRYKLGKGKVLIDVSHENSFKAYEIESLLSKLSSRGLTLELLNISELEKKLSEAVALIVISPKKSFTSEEAIAVKEFTNRGGRVAVFVDSDRDYTVNVLLTEFGIFAEYDYLFNMKNNEGNFRHIFLEEFKNSEVTKGLERIVLYNSCSLNAGNYGIIFTDENTVSSVNLSSVKYSPVALKENLLVVCDQTFLEDEFNAIQDNPKFISLISDWLVNEERNYALADYPNFFSEKLEIINEKDFLDIAIKLKAQVENAKRKTTIVSELSKNNQIILALYDSENLNAYAKEAGIIFSKPDGKTISINGFNFSKDNSVAVIMKKKLNENYVMLILADSKDNLSKTIENNLTFEQLKNNLVSDYFALFAISKKTETA